MRYAERLDKRGLPDRADIERHIDYAAPGARFQTDEYTLEGMGRESWEAGFTYHGFRYVEVAGFPGKPEPEDFEAVFEHTDVAPRLQFACSDKVVERICSATDWSYLSNLQSIPTDCPHREKNGWTADAHLAADQAMFSWDACAVYRKWMNDFDDAQTPGGDLPGIVPSGGWGYGVWGPAWDSAFLLIPETVRIYDAEPLADLRVDAQSRYVDSLLRQAPDGIVDAGYGDWAPFKTYAPPACTSTAFAVQDALLLSQTLARLGRQMEARRYAEAASRLRAAWMERFFDKTAGTVADGSQTALACGLYFDLLPDRYRERVFQRLVRKIETAGHLDFGILGAKWVTNVLAEGGRADLAFSIIMRKGYPSWAWWIEQGATTLWESWDGNFSRNHVMMGDVKAWFVKFLAGIRPESADPGFHSFDVRPELVGGVTSASARYESVRGTICSSWHFRAGVFRLKVLVPPNTRCKVYLPASRVEQCCEGGIPLDRVEGLRSFGIEGNRVRAEVGSGSYAFSVERPVVSKERARS